MVRQEGREENFAIDDSIENAINHAYIVNCRRRAFDWYAGVVVLTFCFLLLQLSQAWAVRCRCSMRPSILMSSCANNTHTNQVVP